MKKTALPRTMFTQKMVPASTMNQITCVNIYKDGKFNMNGKLAASLGGKTLELSFTDDGQHFLLEESSGGAQSVRFPKSGSRRMLMVTELLEQQHIMLPAKYEVWLTEDGVWQGDLLENPMLSQSPKLRSSKKH
ncbi:MAG: hypothetical protein IKU58_00515 [Clostridia bacterium]|nr:hypothetical protein [Clostridia bacterium]